MANEKHLEIERKYLVDDSFWLFLGKTYQYEAICQGYLSKDPERVVRIRHIIPRQHIDDGVIIADNRIGDATAFITIKGKTEGITRAEYEMPMPEGEAQMILWSLCILPLVIKNRYTLVHEGHTWTMDEYKLPEGKKGLLLAEIELASADETFDLPPWVGEEVSHDPAYFNSNMG